MTNTNTHSTSKPLRVSRQRLVIAGLWASLLWSCPTWVFAQGMGGLGNDPLSRNRNPLNEGPRYQPPVFERAATGEPVVAVKIVGNEAVKEDRIRPQLQTRVGRDFEADVVQADVRRLSSTGLFRNVRTYRKPVNGGVEVTFEVFELPTIRYVKLVGNEHLRTNTLLKKSELKEGEPLHRYRVEESVRLMREYYIEKGYSDVQIDIKEGLEPDDQGVVLSIFEGEQQRIFRTVFIGNTIASDARLRTQIESKPGIMWVFKGKVDRDQIEEDRDRLTAYYRSLGFFKARVGRYLDYSESGKWLTLTYVIDEGPRYKIRNVSLVGNETFTTDSLMGRIELDSGDFFDARMMNRDLNALRDTYGGEGYIHADIKADPRFLEEPGIIDLVYDIQEGDQYRVGNIIVNIEGEHPHTRRNVVINRLSLAPNDIIDINEIRASERRLRSSQLFLADPARGITPTIAIRPPEMSQDTRMAERPDERSDNPSAY